MEYVNKTATTWQDGTNIFEPLSSVAFAELGVRLWVYLKPISGGWWEVRSADGTFLAKFPTHGIAHRVSIENDTHPFHIH